MISVVIPHFNDSEHLAQCLEALMRQTHVDSIAEILVVDNGSRELPVEVCARFPKVRLLSESTPGPGPARSTGAKEATQPILAFIDSDCFADPQWIEAIIKHFQAEKGADIIGGDVGIYHLSARMSALEAFESVFGYRFALYIKRDKFCGTGNMAVHRDLFYKVGPFAGLGVAEDRDWGQRATAMGYVVGYVPEMRVKTPARTSFSELTRKWDRHVHHDYEELPSGIVPQMQWLIKTAMMAVSPFFDMFRLFGSRRLRGLGNRLRGARCLFRIRWYRARKMLAIWFRHDSAAAGNSWRKVD